jgi:Protein of unknown function (DUF2799)
MHRLLPILAAAVLLAACASLSEEECRAGDWFGIGFSDGAAGRTVEHIARHREACAEVGVTPELDAWLAGRAEGLRRYCTPENAYRVGRSGRAFSPVCPAGADPELRRAYLAGREQYEIGREIARLERDLDFIDASLAGLDGDLDRDERRQRRRLLDERSWIGFRLQRLEFERLRYGHWPPI